jgi:hypothetical protein
MDFAVAHELFYLKILTSECGAAVPRDLIRAT